MKNEHNFDSGFGNLREKTFLVVGATGHVGSKVAIRLAEKGYDVTAMVRQEGATIRDSFNGVMKYVVGDLKDLPSIRKAVAGKDVVVSSANGILPQKQGDNARNVNESALDLIRLCEEAGVSRFVQSSVPLYKNEKKVPELYGKRLIEQRLKASSMQTVVIRNAAFMDVFIPMGGFRQAQDASHHATTKRNYDFAQRFMQLTGDFVEKYGIYLAPGGAKHGTPIIATRDVAEMVVGGALYEGADNLLVEAGGPEWLTWGKIADIIGRKTGKKVRVFPMPAWLIAINRTLAAPFSPAAENMFALMGFVANHQPHWEAPSVVERFRLPKQITVGLPRRQLHAEPLLAVSSAQISKRQTRTPAMKVYSSAVDSGLCGGPDAHPVSFFGRIFDRNGEIGKPKRVAAYWEVSQTDSLHPLVIAEQLAAAPKPGCTKPPF